HRVALGEDAGRNAYMAGFHAAQALIYERTGKVSKTHHGVHAQFDALARSEPTIDAHLRPFLAQAYKLKAVADYETGPEATISLEVAAAAIEIAHKFIDRISGLLGIDTAPD